MTEPADGLPGRFLPHHRHCYQFSCFFFYFAESELLLWRLVWIKRLYSDSKLSESCQSLTTENSQFAKRMNVVP